MQSSLLDTRYTVFCRPQARPVVLPANRQLLLDVTSSSPAAALGSHTTARACQVLGRIEAHRAIVICWCCLVLQGTVGTASSSSTTTRRSAARTWCVQWQTKQRWQRTSR